MAAPRRFDYDEAVARHAAGETYAEIAADYGVTEGAVYRAVRLQTDPDFRAHKAAVGLAWQRGRYRKPCVNGCGRIAWHGPKRGGGVCLRCSAAGRAESVSDTTLRCGKCREWLPDASFPRQAAAITRRGRHSLCRSCQTVARRRTRERHKTPCAVCGTSRLGNPRFNDTGLCRACYRESRPRRPQRMPDLPLRPLRSTLSPHDRRQG